MSNTKDCAHGQPQVSIDTCTGEFRAHCKLCGETPVKAPNPLPDHAHSPSHRFTYKSGTSIAVCGCYAGRIEFPDGRRGKWRIGDKEA